MKRNQRRCFRDRPIDELSSNNSGLDQSAVDKLYKRPRNEGCRAEQDKLKTSQKFSITAREKKKSPATRLGQTLQVIDKRWWGLDSRHLSFSQSVTLSVWGS